MSLGIYRWVIRSSNGKLARQLIKGCIASAIFFVLFTYLLPPARVTPRSLFVIYGLCLVAGTCGIRFAWQNFFDAGQRGEPIAIYGAGEAGLKLLFSMAQGREYQPVVFLDDDESLVGSTLGGVPIEQASSPEVRNVLDDLEVEKIVLAIPSLSSTEYQMKFEYFEQLGLAVQTIPTLTELVEGTAKLSQIRDISISDILGRAEVPPNPKLLEKCVRDKVVLVTGGGGSIGSELCRQIMQQGPKKLIVLDHAEENLYKITEELTQIMKSGGFVASTFLPRLCSVNDADKVEKLFNDNGIQTVYHAAAYKHVPIIEEQPEQGVKVNIFGTLTMLEASIRHNVENFVLISTDKAVRPTNAMGASKRVAELILQAKALQKHKTKISMVRFGNVLGSSGSVVPKFKKQIEAGGPITLTDREITRYFMTIPEAAQLVMQAGAVATGGDVFVLDMGKPVRIEDLAVSMVRMSGKKLFKDTGNENDIRIVETGLRPGEKMYEELFITDGHRPTQVQKVFSAVESQMEWGKLQNYLNQLDGGVEACDRDRLKALLLELAFYKPAPIDKHSVVEAV